MKIAIIGAGPAGSNCAYWAAKEGHDVYLFEKEKVLANKPCGEAIFGEAFNFTPIKPNESKWALNYIYRAEIYFENDLLLETETKPLDGYIVNKRAFLEEIVEEAKAQGAKYFREAFVDEKSFDLVIDAGGYTSTFARRKGLSYDGFKFSPALRGYGKTDKIRDDTLYFQVYDFGYAWIFPYGENFCNFGIGGHVNSRDVLLNHLFKFLKLFDVEVSSKIEGAPFPSNGPLSELTIGNIRVVGDTAGMVMPISGEGIRFALYAGSICFKENYEKLFQAKYGEKLRTGKKILDLWLHMTLEDIKELIRTVDPSVLAKVFIEGEKPNALEGIKLLRRPKLFSKTIKSLYLS
ncbi:MAG TPA: NAD(P)/FAD-dependent oxidoreductase [Geobacterales bacterium]|nr:NAD(P)/FAD-dependent oxidoreductase [Geobacterales bacterium]